MFTAKIKSLISVFSRGTLRKVICCEKESANQEVRCPQYKQRTPRPDMLGSSVSHEAQNKTSSQLLPASCSSVNCKQALTAQQK